MTAVVHSIVDEN